MQLKRPHRGDPGMLALEPVTISSGLEGGDACGAKGRRGAFRHECEGALEFEDREGVRIHALGLTPLARAPRERWH